MLSEKLDAGREFVVGDLAANTPNFRNNFVRTFKYTLVSFVPKNLFGAVRGVWRGSLGVSH